MTPSGLRFECVLAGLLGGCLLLGGCSQGNTSTQAGTLAAAEEATMAAESVMVATRSPETPLPSRSGLADPAFETALVPLHDIEIFSRMDGEVVAVDFEEGRRVAPGQRLAQLDDRDRRATLDMREAQVDRAEAAWQRAQKLHEQGVISEEQFILSRSEWQIARAQRDGAKVELDRCAVRTPIRGLVEQRLVQLGQSVKEGDLLFRIGDPDTLRAELLLPESRLGTVRAGQPVRIIPTSGGPVTVARVTRVNPLVDAASGTFRVVIDIDNRAGRLHGGVSARVVFEGLTAETR